MNNTPWKVGKYKDIGFITDGKDRLDIGRIVGCLSYREEKLNQIATACNTHEELVTALKCWASAVTDEEKKHCLKITWQVLKKAGVKS